MQVDLIGNQLFDIMDGNCNGVVDGRELAAGVALLCGSRRPNRLRAAFSVFDGDGGASPKSGVM